MGLLLPYEPPFTDIAPTGPERVFDEGRVVKLVRKIEEISESVVA
jgi:type I restriction enzyme R subunit